MTSLIYYEMFSHTNLSGDRSIVIFIIDCECLLQYLQVLCSERVQDPLSVRVTRIDGKKKKATLETRMNFYVKIENECNLDWCRPMLTCKTSNNLDTFLVANSNSSLYGDWSLSQSVSHVTLQKCARYLQIRICN